MKKKKYIWSKEHGKMMLLGDNGELIDEPSKPFDRNRILSLSIFRNDKIKGDGFKPHYSKDLGGWVSTRGEFEAKCKEKGFSCAGTDAPPQYKEKDSGELMSEKAAKELNDQGIKISENDRKLVNSATTE